MKVSKKDLFLFAAPLLVFLTFFLLRGLNNAIIFRDEQRQMKTGAIPNTNLIRRPQPDGSVNIVQLNESGKEQLVFHEPPRPKSKGLFKLQYLVLSGAALLLLSVAILVVSIVVRLLHKQRLQRSS